MSVRTRMQMSDDEVGAFLEHEKTVICATSGPRGWPHLMPLWYVIRDGDIWAWTYAKSQKARNLERDGRASLVVEAGDRYSELRGVMLECDTVVHGDVETVYGYATEQAERYPDEDDGYTDDELRRQSEKRVAVQFVERHRISWDHRKLSDAA